jgi:hypothetical protein
VTGRREASLRDDGGRNSALETALRKPPGSVADLVRRVMVRRFQRAHSQTAAAAQRQAEALSPFVVTRATH